MHRTAILSAAAVMLMSISTSSVMGQLLSPAPKSPGEIAAASRLLAEKQENCRLQAKQQKLTFLKRRRFARECMKKSP
jgi:hypothetical protein